MTPGDLVVVHTVNGATVGQVERVTATQVTVAGNKYRRSDGRLVSGPRNSPHTAYVVALRAPDAHESGAQSAQDG